MTRAVETFRLVVDGGRSLGPSVGGRCVLNVHIKSTWDEGLVSPVVGRDAVIIEKVAAIIVNGLCKHNARLIPIIRDPRLRSFHSPLGVIVHKYCDPRGVTAGCYSKHP